jgi:nucleoside-diphosphate-sugar epimerase
MRAWPRERLHSRRHEQARLIGDLQAPYPLGDRVRILVTGATGFIGSHLVAELERDGHEIAGISLPVFDLRQPSLAANLIREVEPDLMIHLAAKVGRLFGEDDVAETIADNAGMTALVAKACGENGVRMVYASTSEVYGDQGAAICYEGGPLNLPHNAYGLSKLWGEEACRLYAPDELTVWRISMPYGAGLPAGRGRAAIINMLWQADQGDEIPVHRGAERSWCHISDTVRAMRLTLTEPGGIFNVGRDDASVSMRRVAEIACALTDSDTERIVEVDAPARQTVVKRLATNKIRALGWAPEVDLVEGMERTLAWIRDEMPVAA